MVRRHPHVFGQTNADTPDEVLTNWEEIKKEEKQGKEWITSPLREIPLELPALTRATKVLKKVDKLYEKGNSYEQDVEILQKAVDALKICSPQAYSEEIGRIMADALIALSDIARICKLSQEQILTDRIDDIIDNCENAQNAEKKA
jgi:tetrapyrrole methylase family protein/MazG family protein